MFFFLRMTEIKAKAPENSRELGMKGEQHADQTHFNNQLLRKEIVELKKDRESFINEIAILKRKINEYESERIEADRLIANRLSLQESLTETQEKYESLVKEKRTTRHKHEKDIQKLKIEVETLHLQLSEMVVDKEKLNELYKVLKTENDRLKESTTSVNFT